jgi:hypothetical protein
MKETAKQDSESHHPQNPDGGFRVLRAFEEEINVATGKTA